jgi:hypothetical protein
MSDTPTGKEPMIGEASRPTAIDFDAEMSKVTLRQLSAVITAQIEVFKAEKEVIKPEKEKEQFKPEKEKEWSKPEKEALKGEKEKETFKPEKEKEQLKPEKEKEWSKPEKEALKGEKEKEQLKPEGFKPELKPFDQIADRIAQTAADKVIGELRRQGVMR